MKDEGTDTWTLHELADSEDVTPRTVRYYIAQGLLPPPLGAGPATRYGEGHAYRLRLIRELQRQHLPLADIRSRLERLRDDEVADVLAGYVRKPTPASSDSALEYIRTVLSPPPADPVDRLQRHASSAQAGPAPPPPAAATLQPPMARSAREASAPYAEPPPPPASAAPARSQWERIALAPDIELHVRRPLSRFQNRAVDRLIIVARQLLEEDPS